MLYYLFHIDIYLLKLITNYGSLIYLTLFIIIFCESGLVIFPFLPGDSLLFAAGSVAALPGQLLNCALLFSLLIMASILGNQLNYLIGRHLGLPLIKRCPHWLINPTYVKRAQDFYRLHGGKTIIFARYIPIIRTFAPFIAGISLMPIERFALCNIVSGILWVGSLIGAGYLFGTIPIIQNNFTLVIYFIIALSLLPLCTAYIKRNLHF